jgi:hypothetical protein
MRKIYNFLDFFINFVNLYVWYVYEELIYTIYIL